MLAAARPACTLLILASLSACATASGKGVPKLNPERLIRVSFTPVVPRQVELTLADERDPLPETSAATVAELDRAVRAVMTRAGVTVESGARNRLALTVRYPDADPERFKREDCVEVHGTMVLWDKTEASSRGQSCFAQQHVTGIRAGGDASMVYEAALNSALEGIDEALGKYAGR